MTEQKVDFQNDTLLLYLNDTYQFEGRTRLVAHGKDEVKGAYVVLEETIFYPQGGGQPSDVGTIEIEETGTILNVHFVSFVNGRVHHYVKESVEDLKPGSSSFVKIDSERRLKNAKSHTSGHLLANIVEALAPELTGIKGYHFPEGPYVEFKGKLTSLTNAHLIEKLVQIAKEKIASNTDVSAREVDPDTLKNSGEYHLPSGKKARVVQIDGYEPVPCGGTHLKNLSELKEVTIRKIQSAKENTRVAYSFA
jgi:Ser-tRNA(Ala) deacylase AlaX